MRKDLALEDLYRQFKCGSLDRKGLEGEMFSLLLEEGSRFGLHGWDRDNRSDYLSWLYPRLARAVDAYREQGSSFDAYISAIVRWSTREYRTQASDRRAAETAFWEGRAAENDAAASTAAEAAYEEDAPAYDPGTTGNDPEPLRPCIKNRRQVLILVLKCYSYLSDDFRDRIAASLHMDRYELKNMVDELRALREERDTNVRKLQDHIHLQFFRCLCYERRISAAPEASAHRQELMERHAKAKTRLNSMRSRLAAMRQEATNLQVAQVLGLPKGTVDSNLHALRWKWGVNRG